MPSVIKDMKQPRIFVHLSYGCNSDGLYMVKYPVSVLDGMRSSDGYLRCIRSNGTEHTIGFAQIKYADPEKCIFFRGVMAELLYIIFGETLECFTNIDIQILSKWAEEIESIVPERLWADKR